ncbi:hypothetical protein BV22DRAFT_1035295 [Leucogyrophana mollusca]|uniref:Uncharacterized protein n=1 Tax=Leucogyrophana mollusca TaxID=85980 RepID=A0ACB8BER0_9AGAM|nr:hypothetical protein BV22DRAFT_1035295 [Leucogyrophana mollusca]
MATTVTRTNTKTAEFAKLFELFDRVATRRSRADTGAVIALEDIASVPPEFAPVLKNMSTLLSIRAQRDQDQQIKPTGRPRRNTVGAAPSGRVAEHEESVQTFPLEERYPFTFKLMLHKLYDLEEWAEKVKSAVEASKEQFKPLAERVQGFAEGKGRPERKVMTRARSHSVITPPKITKPAPEHKSSSEEIRVLKKRCVGRRKSVSGPMAGGVWVYDAAIASVEGSGPRSAMELTFSGPKDITNVPEPRSRHQSLAGLEGIGARDTARRKVKIAIPLARPSGKRSAEEVHDSHPVSWQWDIPRSGTTSPTAAEIITKRRALSLVAEHGAPESLKRAAMKRPLSS